MKGAVRMGLPQAHISKKTDERHRNRDERIKPAIQTPINPPYPTPLELPKHPADHGDITSAGTRIIEIDL